MDEIAHLQRGQRIELAYAEGLPGIKRLEEHRAEAVVWVLPAVDQLAPEIGVPDHLAADPDLVAVGQFLAFAELRPLKEIGDRFAVIGEAETRVQIGNGLDVVGLQPVVCVDIVGMLADNGTYDMKRIDAVLRSRLLDLSAQLGVGRQQLVDLGVFGLVGRLAGLGA